jgi:hypothetical protein
MRWLRPLRCALGFGSPAPRQDVGWHGERSAAISCTIAMQQ